MKKRSLILFGCVLVVFLVLSCAPAATPTPVPAAPTATKAPSPAPSPPPGAPSPPPAKAITPTPAPLVAEKPQYGGFQLTCIESDAPSFDMHQETSYTVSHSIQPAYNNLIQNDPMQWGKIVPDLAEKWEISKDGLTYTFHLVKGVKFHDGKPFTSADAKFSLGRTGRPPSGMISPRQASFAPIDSIETPDPYTLVLKLQYASASLIDHIASPYQVVVPKHVVEEKGDMKRTVLGTGAFKWKKYTKGVGYELEKNPDYFVKGLPYLEGIKRYIIPENSSQFAAFRAGRLNHWRVPEASYVPMINDEMDGKAIVQSEVLLCTTQMIPRYVKPFDDFRVRRAVSLALDRRQGAELMGKGVRPYYQGAFTTPVGLWAFLEAELVKMPGWGLDVAANRAEAKKLLAAAGYPNGFHFKLRTRKLTSYTDPAVWLLEQLKTVGITSELEILETTAFFDALVRKDFLAMILVFCYGIDDPDAMLGEHFLKGAGRNYTEYDNAKFNELFDKQSRELDPGQRKKYTDEMQKILFESLPEIIFFWSNQYIAHTTDFRGWKITPSLHGNYRFAHVWLAK